MIEIINNSSNNTLIQEAVNQSNRILNNPDFYIAIAQHEAFDMSNLSPKQIAEMLQLSSLKFEIRLFDPQGLKGLKYRKTFAYTDKDYPNTLFLNKDKLNRKSEEIAKTIVHEAVHALDNAEDKGRFGHGNNRSEGKKNTAPYWIANLAYTMFKSAM